MRQLAPVDRSLSSLAWYGLGKRVLRLAAALVYHARYSGQENVPSDGPLIVVSNHQSHLDPPMVGCGCPRRLNFFARKSLFDSPAFGWILSSFDSIPVDRETSPLSGLRETLRRLKRGEAVLMFPEGARCSDGRIGPFRSGFALLATRSQATVLPAAIEGAFRAWPRFNRFPRPGIVHVHYGMPIPAKQVASMTEEELMAETASRIRQCHALLRSRPVFRGCRIAPTV